MLERAQKLREAYEMANLRSLCEQQTEGYIPRNGYLVAMRLDSLARRLGVPVSAAKRSRM
jgi:hypothetical protein